MAELDLSEVMKLEKACQERRAGLAKARPVVVRKALCDTRLWQHLEGVYAMPPDILEALHSGLGQVYDEASADALFDAEWLCDCKDRWSDFAVVLQACAVPEDGSPVLPLVLDEYKALLFSIQRLALQNAPQFGNMGRSDADALRDLAMGEPALSLQCSPGTDSNCLIYTLAAGLDAKGLLDFRVDRAKRCQEVRHFLCSSEALRPRLVDGTFCRTAFLEHHRHSRAIVGHLLDGLPVEGIEVVVHARWCANDSPAERLVLGCEAGERPVTTIHTYNYTGRGTRGYHYDLLV
jgi:hypothetical protein